MLWIVDAVRCLFCEFAGTLEELKIHSALCREHPQFKHRAALEAALKGTMAFTPNCECAECRFAQRVLSKHGGALAEHDKRVRAEVWREISNYPLDICGFPMLNVKDKLKQAE
jgi:hypothetical protein